MQLFIFADFMTYSVWLYWMWDSVLVMWIHMMMGKFTIYKYALLARIQTFPLVISSSSMKQSQLPSNFYSLKQPVEKYSKSKNIFNLDESYLGRNKSKNITNCNPSFAHIQRTPAAPLTKSWRKPTTFCQFNVFFFPFLG